MALQAKAQAASPGQVDVARQATERKNDPKHATLGYGVDPLNCAR